MATKRTFPTRTLALLSFVACGLPDRNLGELAGETEEPSGSDSTGDDPSVSSSPSEGGSETTGGTDTDVPLECEDVVPPIPCSWDADQDAITFQCDNAPHVFNPSQLDVDSDGLGDVIDLCPTVAEGATNSADSDHDGIGNACDSCPSPTAVYNIATPTEPGQLVRNIPDVGDADGDGIGDACDNCVIVPNCGSYEPTSPWAPGDPIDRDDPSQCQRDDDQDMIGDACVGSQAPEAAGPVGWLASDDFDQDGLENQVDFCMRLPLVERIACDDDGDCPGSECGTTTGVCNHPDTDADLVGDACDTCAFVPNGDQAEEGIAQVDDEDQDFVGGACEAGCSTAADAAPMAFYSEVSEGLCCTTALLEVDGDLTLAAAGRPLLDPDGLPVRIECSDAQIDAHECKRLPEAVASMPGILTMPPGCTAPGQPLELVGDTDPLAYWSSRCELPQLDQDFDGVGDRCDTCPLAFDPELIPYVDAQGRVWPIDGKYCNGDYSSESCGE